MSDVLALAADTILDLSEFEPRSIEDNFPSLQSFLKVLEWGYGLDANDANDVNGANDANDASAVYHWGRVRAGFCNILSKVPSSSAQLICHLANLESRAGAGALRSSGAPGATASIFAGEVMNESTMECGGFIYALKFLPPEEVVGPFLQTYGAAIQLIVQDGTMPNADDDIRCSTGEALLEVAGGILKNKQVRLTGELIEAFGQIAFAIFFVIFRRNPEQNASEVKGVSFDDSITLSVLDFLECVGQKREVLNKLGEIHVRESGVNNLAGGNGGFIDPYRTGLSLFFAATFRGASGVLPPYAVEFFPGMFRALCASVGDELVIISSLRTAMEMKSPPPPRCATVRRAPRGSSHVQQGEEEEERRQILPAVRAVHRERIGQGAIVYCLQVSDRRPGLEEAQGVH